MYQMGAAVNSGLVLVLCCCCEVLLRVQNRTCWVQVLGTGTGAGWCRVTSLPQGACPAQVRSNSKLAVEIDGQAMRAPIVSFSRN